MKLRFLLVAISMLLTLSGLSAQDVALKTNLLYDATTTINLGAEAQIAPKWSLDLSGNFNGWTFSDGKRWKHWMVQPEGRYWFCEPLGGHFLGFHALGGQYNFGNLDLPDFLGNDLAKLKDYRYQGWYVGAGIAYGYTWLLSKHWNLEAELGIGWAWTPYDKYQCAGCGKKVESGHHNYFGPTKAAINIVYVF